MMKFRENEDAVSPVIGVILMVAITVILAAVIAAFVFGMGSNVGTTKTVAVTVGQNGNNIVLTYQGGADASTLSYLTIVVDSTEGGKGKKTYYTASTSGSVTGTTASIDKNGLEVGAIMTIPNMGTEKRDHVVVTGHFTDGADQVVLNNYV